jgi:hypothetical protein
VSAIPGQWHPTAREYGRRFWSIGFGAPLKIESKNMKDLTFVLTTTQQTKQNKTNNK